MWSGEGDGRRPLVLRTPWGQALGHAELTPTRAQEEGGYAAILLDEVMETRPCGSVSSGSTGTVKVQLHPLCCMLYTELEPQGAGLPNLAGSSQAVPQPWGSEVPSSHHPEGLRGPSARPVSVGLGDLRIPMDRFIWVDERPPFCPWDF